MPDPILDPLTQAQRKQTQFPTLVHCLDATLQELSILGDRALLDTDVRAKAIDLAKTLFPMLLSMIYR